MSTQKELQESYDKDPKIPCKYGVKCYQKNQAHRDKYKHPHTVDQEEKGAESSSKKRSRGNRETDDNCEPTKSPELDSDSEGPEVKKPCVALDSCEKTAETVTVPPKKEDQTEVPKDKPMKQDDSSLACPTKSTSDDHNRAGGSSTEVNKKLIKENFLVEMPQDFYKFYELCKEISPADPSNAFRVVNLLLVGPYDILNGKLLDFRVEDQERYLSHWRYYYDPPEFQTIVKGSDKDGFHFGYWRDDPKENPVFVATNYANINFMIKPAAETIFGAIDAYLEEKLKKVTPFEKPKVAGLRQRLKKFASTHNIELEKITATMKAREKRVVARTLHSAGIVVPYDKKTQVGYRELAMTEATLKKTLQKISEEKDDDEISNLLVPLEEVERWATIAADECDFGTCLELAHDLFSHGNKHVQNMALRMFSTSYTLLNRLEFLQIAKEHCKNRKQGSALSILVD